MLSLLAGELYVSSADSKASSSTLVSRSTSVVPSSDGALAGRPRPVVASALSYSAWYLAIFAVLFASFALARLNPVSFLTSFLN
jgi:hypothetical protein